MKLRHKIFASALPLLTTAPFMLTATGCNKNSFDKLIDSMYQQILDEFNKISKIYRPTYGTELISTFINQEVFKAGLFCEDDYDVMLQHSSEWEQPYPNGHQNGNLMINIPASDGCDNWPIVALQAHMDMVCDGFSGGPITLVTDGDVIHSRDWKTSIGADDGIGLATILTIIKNRNNFTHGPIRCFITVDEEDGEGGAHWLQTEWLDDVKYFINLDHEEQNSVCVQCAGVQQTKINLPCTGVNNSAELAEYPQHYSLKISGVKGGASGFALENNPIFAIQTAFKMLKDIKTEIEGGDHPYMIHNIVTDEVESNGGGSISKNITITFSIPATVDSNKFLSLIRGVYVKTLAQHSSETEFKMSLDDISTSYKPTFGILPEQSTYLISMFAQEDKGLFGDISAPGSEEIITCSNAGPISVQYTAPAEGEKPIVHVIFETFGRSSDEDELGPNPDKTRAISDISSDKKDGMLAYYKETIQTYMGKSEDKTNGIDFTEIDKLSLNNENAWFKSIGWNPCWDGSTISKATEIYMNYAKSKGATMTQFKALGWCESAEFVTKKLEEYKTKEFQMSCVGPTIVDGHTRTGYVLSSSIRALVDRVVYTLTQLSK